MDRFVERAVVLSTVDYGDADRIVTLFTEGRGKVSAFAAGARKSKRRFAGALEPTTLITAQLVERRGSTVRLDGADIVQSFHALRGELSRISRALYCLELCRELVREHEAHPALFALLVDYLGRLEAGKAGPTSLIAFELEALAHAGLMPRFDSCAVCGGPVGDDAMFDPDHGGVVCRNDRARVTGGVRVDPALIAALSALQRGGRTPMPADQRQRAREVLNLFIAHQLGRKLHSVDFLAQVGLD